MTAVFSFQTSSDWVYLLSAGSVRGTSFDESFESSLTRKGEVFGDRYYYTGNVYSSLCIL